jgi:sulfur-oxidizing protein SoxX
MAGVALSFAPHGASGSEPAAPLVSFRVVGDAIPAPLVTDPPPDAARGRAIVTGRDANCILCHAVPGVQFTGDLAPSLAGTGARWSAGQLRLRLVDSTRLNPETIMPAYYRVSGLRQVAAAYAGRPLLDAGQIEDVIAFLCALDRP